jgi:hypothetical protein
LAERAPLTGGTGVAIVLYIDAADVEAKMSKQGPKTLSLHKETVKKLKIKTALKTGEPETADFTVGCHGDTKLCASRLANCG